MKELIMLLVSLGDSSGLEYRGSGRNRLPDPGVEVGESTGGVADTAIVTKVFFFPYALSRSYVQPLALGSLLALVLFVLDGSHAIVLTSSCRQ